MTFTEQLVKYKKGPKQWLLLVFIWLFALVLATIALYTAFAYVGNGISGPFLFAFLYEDWLEYEFSDVSEDNYESLQAIIKKIFRSLERNGIDFKGNN